MPRTKTDSPASKAVRKARAVAPPVRPDLSLEAERRSRGALRVAGIDEAGRGPLAGPVVTAAVILDPDAVPDGLNDSKQLTMEDRERLFPEILRWAQVSIVSSSSAEIDRLNIRQATLLAMVRAFRGLGEVPCHALIDGNDVPLPLLSKASAIVKGDSRSLSIAAASIVAKVTRDRLMQRLCRSFPAYGFSRHMGYATPVHLAALTALGPCPFHRMSFRPIRPEDPLLI